MHKFFKAPWGLVAFFRLRNEAIYWPGFKNEDTWHADHMVAFSFMLSRCKKTHQFAIIKYTLQQ